MFPITLYKRKNILIVHFLSNEVFELSLIRVSGKKVQRIALHTLHDIIAYPNDTTWLICGKVVLEKGIRNDNGKYHIREVLPDADAEHFFYQVRKDGENEVISIARTSSLSALAQDLDATGIPVKDIFLFRDIPDVMKDETRSAQEIRAFPAGEKRKVMENHFRTLSALQPVLHRYRQQKNLETGTLAATFVLFISLLTCLLMGQWNERLAIENYAYELSNREMLDSIQYYQRLLNDKSRIQNMIGQHSNRISVLADRMAMLRPEETGIEEMQLFGVTEDKFDHTWRPDSTGQCIIRGSVADIDHLNQWVARLEESPHFKHVKIAGYLKESPGQWGKYELRFLIQE